MLGNSPANDPTLTSPPHIASVLTGIVAGFLSTKVGLPPDITSVVSLAIGSVVTSAVHWIQAKLVQ
jgi:hypothetical protein